MCMESDLPCWQSGGTTASSDSYRGKDAACWPATLPECVHCKCCTMLDCRESWACVLVRWQNGQADVGHALVAFDSMATVLSHPRVDVAHFWTTRWRYGGFAESNNPGSVADTLNVRHFSFS